MKIKSKLWVDVPIVCCLLGFMAIVIYIYNEKPIEKPKEKLTETTKGFQLSDKLCGENGFIGPSVMVVNGKKITILCR